MPQQTEYYTILLATPMTFSEEATQINLFVEFQTSMVLQEQESARILPNNIRP